MQLRFGIHVGLQDTTVADVLGVARHAEDLGFDWVSAWDHFYPSSHADGGSLEAVSMHTALAAATHRVQCGVLVYCATYRHPAVLAKAAATIDQLSGGRAQIGVGAGWSAREHAAYGIRFPPVAERMDILEESATCLRLLLRQRESEFSGRHFQLNAARLDPRPVQPALPIWIGGAGEKRTLPTAARVADGWNAPFLTAAEFGRKHGVLREHCAAAGRDAGEIRCAANVGVAPDQAAYEQFIGTMSTIMPAGGVLRGSGAQLGDGIARYVDAGANQVNFAFRAPFDLTTLDAIADAMRTFQS
ncbi:TIGR03560 family F420-dependent LLM class oxidoreductase [Amycolatopsis alkalitolerans]|nr:TIGR03560 family F420-dependent LLM class oxidoreductase [Amycolatopsis alkalitolerans]